MVTATAAMGMRMWALWLTLVDVSDSAYGDARE